MKNTKTTLNKGFSLVEMLVVIAVIGIIAAIAVPNIGKINDAAKESTNKRNAQNIASIAAAAQAAGLDFVGGDTADGLGGIALTAAHAEGSAEVINVAKLVRDGATVNDSTSPFDQNFFGSPGMNDDDVASAAAFLKIENGIIQYVGG